MYIYICVDIDIYTHTCLHAKRMLGGFYKPARYLDARACTSHAYTRTFLEIFTYILIFQVLFKVSCAYIRRAFSLDRERLLNVIMEIDSALNVSR